MSNKRTGRGMGTWERAVLALPERERWLVAMWLAEPLCRSDIKRACAIGDSARAEGAALQLAQVRQLIGKLEALLGPEVDRLRLLYEKFAHQFGPRTRASGRPTAGSTAAPSPPQAC